MHSERRNGAMRLIESLDQLFPRREFYLRTDGRVRYLALGRWPQVSMAILALGGLGWVGYASIELVFHEHIVAAKDNRIERMAEAYDKLAERLDQTRQKYSDITQALEKKHSRLAELVQRNSDLKIRLGQASSDIETLQRQRDEALLREGTLERKLGEAESNLEHVLAENTELQDSLKLTTDTLAAVVEERDATRRKTAELAESLDDTKGSLEHASKARESLSLRLAMKIDEASALEAERDATRERLQAESMQAERERNLLRQRAESLENRLTDLDESQNRLVTELNERTVNNIEKIEGVVSVAGLDPDELIDRAEQSSGIGGPFVSLSEIVGARPGTEARDSQFGNALLSLESRLRRWTALNMLLERLPLTAPVDNSRISSKYGKRKDPFTKRWAMHSGLDMAAPRGTAIYAPAPGTVISVGWSGPYGRLIEIDHGLGVITRYGHLRRIKVKKGQKVEFRDRIGTMGSSGRSSGSHLHYEIRVDGKTVDPQRFIEAGRHVFKEG